jgi:hypothetical protein
VELNPLRQEYSDAEGQPSDQVRNSDAPDSWAAEEDALQRRQERRRTWALLGAVLLAICMTGSVVGFVLYNRATRIDRSTPVVAVFQYVDAIFEQRDAGQAKLFECEKASGRAALDAVLDDLEERERRYGIHISVSVTNFASSVEGTSAQVQADLLIDVPEADGKLSRSSQRWNFDLRDEDGWRVCSAQRVP